jgi:hypothetical protein
MVKPKMFIKIKASPSELFIFKHKDAEKERNRIDIPVLDFNDVSKLW